MISAKQLVSSAFVKEAYDYLAANPMANLSQLLTWADRILIGKKHRREVDFFREIIQDSNGNWYKLIQRYFSELNPTTQKRFLINFMVNAGLVGGETLRKNREKYGCNVPWAILFDPTAACNLKCAGCWAAEYGKDSELDYATMRKIVTQGKALGTHMYILSGGEPTIRKAALLRLAEEHSDCMFLAFTNGTLIDEAFAREIERLGNFAFAVSVEGFEEETDMRRGQGTYLKVMEAMDILRKHGIIFGFSTCYHSKNAKVAGSDAFVDSMIAKGCTFGWYFTYLPIGRNAPLDLLAKPEDREFMYHQVRRFRKTKPCFILDFWNDGEHIDGCIAGGRCYLHINANGDVEPCAFIHYSNVNIKETNLLDALRSPLFMEYKRRQPFSNNHLRPCPLLDNPEVLRSMVHTAKAHSTQMHDQETVEELTAKTENAARLWRSVADRLWRGQPRQAEPAETEKVEALA